MKKEHTITIFIALLIAFASMIGYHTGYAKGTSETLITVATLGAEMVDIDLTDKAKSLLISNPAIVFQVLSPETLDKLYSDLNLSAEAKGGVGANWNSFLELGDI